MKVPFSKMHAQGNDFMITHQGLVASQLTPESISQLGDRRKGIGFDQLLVLLDANPHASSYTYRVFNADGSEVEQCVNGARCLGWYLHTQRMTTRPTIYVKTHTANNQVMVEGANQVSAVVGPPANMAPYVLDQAIQVPGLKGCFEVSIPNPHVVLWVEDLQTISYTDLGAQISAAYGGHGANVEFVALRENGVNMRVIERGVGETLSCGSGICAVAISAYQNQWFDVNGCSFHLLGGMVTVSMVDEAHVSLSGDVSMVYTGEVEWPSL